MEILSIVLHKMKEGQTKYECHLKLGSDIYWKGEEGYEFESEVKLDDIKPNQIREVKTHLRRLCDGTRGHGLGAAEKILYELHNEIHFDKTAQETVRTLIGRYGK